MSSKTLLTLVFRGAHVPLRYACGTVPASRSGDADIHTATKEGLATEPEGAATQWLPKCDGRTRER